MKQPFAELSNLTFPVVATPHLELLEQRERLLGERRQSREEQLDEVGQRVLGRLPQQLAEPRLEADPEHALHDLAHALVRQDEADGRQHQRAQHLHYLHEHHLVRAGVDADEPEAKEAIIVIKLF